MPIHRTVLGPGAIFPGGGVESAPEAPVAAPVAPKPAKPAKAKPVIAAPETSVGVKPLQVIEANDDLDLPMVTLPVEAPESLLSDVSEETQPEVSTTKKSRKPKKDA